MKKHFFVLIMILILVFLTVFPVNAFSQEKFKFGKIDEKELQMTRCPFDSSADAMILCDIGRAHYEYSDIHGFELIFDRFTRIKIFTKNGYQWANYEFPYYYSENTEEKVESLRGYTYNLESGKIIETKLTNESVFEEVQDLHRKVKKISFQAVREGSVVELKYTIRSPFIGDLRDWYFQSRIPVHWSEYEVSIPEYYNFSRQAFGYHSFCINESSSRNESINFQQMTYDESSGVATIPTGSVSYTVNYIVNTNRLAARDVPALKEEPFAKSLKNYYCRVLYEMQSYQYPGGSFHAYANTWEVIISRYLNSPDFGQQLKRSGLVDEMVREIETKAEKPIDKVNEAHKYISTHFKWNGINSDYPTTNLRQAFKNHTGNSADLNLALILLLRELGIKTDPVLLSTNDNGFLLISQPTINGLNYVVGQVTIDSLKFLLDATSRFLPFNYIPLRCLNGEGIVLATGLAKWVPLLTVEKDNSLYFAELRIDSTGEINGKLQVSHSGYAAVDLREKLNASGQESFTKEQKQKMKAWEISEISCENTDNPEESLKISYGISSTEMSQHSGEMIYLNAFAGFGININPFAAEKRKFPIDFKCPYKDSYVFSYEVPNGYKVESLPEPLKFSLPDQAGSFKFIAVVRDNKINVNSSLSLTKTMFTAEEYNQLKEFFEKAVAKHSQQIVMKKVPGR